MKYISVTEFSKKWNIPERTVRNYCKTGKLNGSFITGKTWNILEDAALPYKSNKKAFSNNELLNVLKEQKDTHLKGGIYHRLQVDMTFNSNHIEGSKLTQEQTRLIFETKTIGISKHSINIDDILETVNHFRCIDTVIDNAKKKLTETFIKELHLQLKSDTSDSARSWFKTGEYKVLPNEVGGLETTPPRQVHQKIQILLNKYHSLEKITLENIVEFHRNFELIHPFQDGNGRIGRLVMLKECLKNNITPFIIDEDLKYFYYRGLKEWSRTHGYLLDTCLTAQDKFKTVLKYFKLPTY